MYGRPWFRIAFSFLLFVMLGTLGLICLLNAAFQRFSHSEFVALATTNAEFIRSAHLPQTDRLAGYLSQMLGVEARFHDAGKSDASHEAVTVAIEPGTELTLIRARPTLRDVLLRPVALVTLLAFWALWFALAWSVVRPYLKAQRLALLGQMVTGLAHEIQNPVSAIRLHGQLLAQAQPEGANLIVAEASKIESLVNQWLFLARPEPPRKTEIQAAELIGQTVRLLTPAAEHARVQIVIKAASGQTLCVDARRMGQVFHNLILNAIQAMPKGGTLTITAEGSTIDFADTGPGFSTRALKHWSEMLFSEKEGGMGVGLSVAHEIVTAHGGKLTVANRPAGGALVRINL